MLSKAGLYARIAGYMFVIIGEELSYIFSKAAVRLRARLFGSIDPAQRDRTIVIVGASFAGHHVARLVAGQLSPQSRYRVVVIEPNSHFQFTWVLPRFCVVKGHEEKAFIPYGRYASSLPGVLEWIQDRVVSIDKTHVRLAKGLDPIQYDYLVLATGSGVKTGLPSRVNATEKSAGVELIRDVQRGIETAKTVVVVGGGAAGMEVATDAKDLYPDKNIILVHSRPAVMHRFGKRLQDEAMQALKRLGVEVILEDRVVDEDPAAKKVTLRSGREISCDYFVSPSLTPSSFSLALSEIWRCSSRPRHHQVNCTGQAPCSQVLASVSPNSISPNGYIKVKPTLQVADEELSHVYACGDVADTETPCPNARSALRQATTVARNVLRAVDGKEPKYEYRSHWADTFIKLTLGLDRSTTFMGDGHKDLMFRAKEKNITLMVKQTWARLGQTPYEDKYDGKEGEEVKLE
ncbi:hypothetical protein QQS21_003292 [Conoideocrella luteorostrata]|uniref:FAD/NAD(P)-binding domain-containing protein n=1 Tax=Conoideocrella luteorostrata TaxID=1105319 RepID=A0AAJ0G0N8_9HYPO|nr:hypothetical protein QQS21_003292 [Conoideocrella luteorostrata]